MDTCFREVGLCGWVVNLVVETIHLAHFVAALTPGCLAAHPALSFESALWVCALLPRGFPWFWESPFVMCLSSSLVLLLQLHLESVD